MPFSWRTKKVNLLIASYTFYAAWNPPFVILLWASTVVDWFCSSGTRAGRPTMEVARLDAALGRCRLVILSYFKYGHFSYFKYGHFLLENFVHLTALAGLKYVRQR